MKKRLLATTFLFLNAQAAAEDHTGDGMPAKYLSSCEADFNKDGLADVALLMETLNGGREAIVLHRTKEGGYQAHVVSTGKPNMFLSCHFGSQLVARNGGKEKIYKTNGTYLRLTKPESSVLALFWDGKKYVEVWTND